MFDIIAEACGAVRRQAPRDLPPGSCQNFAIGLAWLLHQRGIPASITGGAAWWRVGPEQADLIEYDPAVYPDSFHCWCSIQTLTGPVFVDASTFTLPGLPPHLIWQEQQGPAWRYVESAIPLPQIRQAQEQLQCVLQPSPPQSSLLRQS
jgi:hypothetical protein